MRSGFVALSGIPFGLLTITRGLGGIGSTPIEEAPVAEDSNTLLGHVAPVAIPENKKAPSALLYNPGAKKKRGR